MNLQLLDGTKGFAGRTDAAMCKAFYVFKHYYEWI